MFERFRLISILHGRKVLAILTFLLLALVALSAVGAVLLDSAFPATIAIGGLFLGWLLRRPIVTYMGNYADRLVFWVLAVYGVVIFLGKRMNWGHVTTLTIITAATVLVFNLRFWVASDLVWAFTRNDNSDADIDPDRR
jgi:hypothetical protein